MGGTDETKEGTWTWVSGEPWLYPNWGTDQPDEGNGVYPENYLAFSPESPLKWNDLKADQNRPFTCEWDNSTAQIPTGETILVTSVEDSGAGSLRQAILDAQAGDTITFDPLVFPPG